MCGSCASPDEGGESTPLSTIMMLSQKLSELSEFFSSAISTNGGGDSIFFSTTAICFAYLFAIPTLIWLTGYLVPQIYMALRPVPNLKKKYNATWSLVTGAGSGIGKALAFKLASQGLNVVVVSLDDDYLKETMKELKEHYPDLEFRSVGTTFSPGVPYLDKIKEATKDIDVNVVFNNAGYVQSLLLVNTIQCHGIQLRFCILTFIFLMISHRKDSLLLVSWTKPHWGNFLQTLNAMLHQL